MKSRRAVGHAGRLAGVRMGALGRCFWRERDWAMHRWVSLWSMRSAAVAESDRAQARSYTSL